MSYIAQKKNRVIRIQEEKAEEYAAMGYEVTNDDGEVVFDAVVTSIVEAKETIAKLTAENEELKAKLKESTLYANDATEKIAELEAAAKDHGTADAATPDTADSGKKTTAKAAKKAE